MSNNGNDYKTNCRNCNQRITMSQRSGKWAPYDAMGAELHQCPAREGGPQQKQQTTSTMVMEAPPPPVQRPPPRPPAFHENAQPPAVAVPPKLKPMKIMILTSPDNIKVEEMYAAWGERVDIRYSQYQFSGALHSVCVWYVEK